MEMTVFLKPVSICCAGNILSDGHINLQRNFIAIYEAFEMAIKRTNRLYERSKNVPWGLLLCF